MRLSPEEIERQLPYYLTLDQKEGLAKALKDFRDHRTGDFFTGMFQGEPMQGDCWLNVPFYDHLGGKLRNSRALILSNSCDISEDNPRDTPRLVTLAPIIGLDRIENGLSKRGLTHAQIASKLSSIRDQTTTHIFYLPSNFDGCEYVVFLDQAQSMPLSFFKEHSGGNLFSLSMFGFYLMLFKLSVHYCRFHENIDRP